MADQVLTAALEDDTDLVSLEEALKLAKEHQKAADLA
jgi:hypothetical protein